MSKKYTQEQIRKVLKEIDAGATIASVSRTLNRGSDDRFEGEIPKLRVRQRIVLRGQ